MTRTNKLTRFSIAFVVLVVLAVVVLQIGNASIHRGTELEQAAEAGGRYLVRHFDMNRGVYDYRYDPLTDEVLSGYNLLRHAGTTYSLLELYRARGGTDVLETAERAVDWILAQRDACPPPYEEYVCVYEGDFIKLGGSGLTILALVESYRATGNQERLDQAAELAGWLLASLSKDGEFTIHKQAQDGMLDDHISLYYPGEAIFGLVRLGEATGNMQYIESAAEAARWLITVRDAGLDESELEHDHWLLYGLNELDKLAPDPLFVEHAEKIVRAIEALQHRSNVAAEWVGGFYNPPRNTPTATRVEGLAAAYDLFERSSNTEMATRARTTMELGVAFMLRMYVDAEKAASYPNPKQALGGFTGSFEDKEIRIDYVQHSISALLSTARMLESGEEVR